MEGRESGSLCQPPVFCSVGEGVPLFVMITSPFFEKKFFVC